MIQKVNTQNEYNALEHSTTESDLTLISQLNQVEHNGVNVQTREPITGDAVYHKDGKVYFFKGEEYTMPDGTIWNEGFHINASLLTSAGFTLVGTVIERKPEGVLIIDKGFIKSKYYSVIQHSITAIDSSVTSITIKLRVAGSYNTDTSVAVDLSGIDVGINEATATAICAAILATGSGYNSHKWWAFLGDKNLHPTTDSATGDAAPTQIVIQNDLVENWNQINTFSVTATGGGVTIKIASSLDGNPTPPSANNVLCKDGIVYSGASMPDILPNQHFGIFNLPNGSELTKKYADKVYYKYQDTEQSIKFLALNSCQNRYTAYTGVDGIGNKGDWFTMGVHEGVPYGMTYDIMAATAAKTGAYIIPRRQSDNGLCFAQLSLTMNVEIMRFPNSGPISMAYWVGNNGNVVSTIRYAPCCLYPSYLL